MLLYFFLRYVPIGILWFTLEYHINALVFENGNMHIRQSTSMVLLPNNVLTNIFSKMAIQRINGLRQKKVLKAPIYFKRNRRANWCDVVSNKIRPKRLELHPNGLGETSCQNKLSGKIRHDWYTPLLLPSVCGDYVIGMHGNLFPFISPSK